MIEIVTKAEEKVEVNASNLATITEDELTLYQEKISNLRRQNVTAKIVDAKEAYYFSTVKNIDEIVHKGPLTPEHVIRTKPFPLVVDKDFEIDLEDFVQGYKQYFYEHAKDEIMLDVAPRYAIIKNRGVVVFGTNEKENRILSDIVLHTIKAMIRAVAVTSPKL